MYQKDPKDCIFRVYLVQAFYKIFWPDQQYYNTHVQAYHSPTAPRIEVLYFISAYTAVLSLRVPLNWTLWPTSVSFDLYLLIYIFWTESFELYLLNWTLWASLLDPLSYQLTTCASTVQATPIKSLLWILWFIFFWPVPFGFISFDLSFELDRLS